MLGYRRSTAVGLILGQLFAVHSAFLSPKIPTRRRHRCYLSAQDTSDSCEEIGVGIDLGTTNSAIAFLKDDVPTIIEIPNNGKTMPSVVVFPDHESDPLVGKEAIAWEAANQATGYRHTKRVIGVGSNHISESTIKIVPHIVGTRAVPNSKKRKQPSLEKQLHDAVENPVMLSKVVGGDSLPESTINPKDIASEIIKPLLRAAKASTGKAITRAVIGVPAYFNDAQRDATIEAAKAAGISKVKLLREPEAAALAYGVDFAKVEEELVLVLDLGGGTYDVSILLVGDGLTEIISSGGNAELGGSNFDSRIAREMSIASGVSLKDPEVRDAMIVAAEKVRIHLSNNREVNLMLPKTVAGWKELADASSVIVNKREQTDRTQNESGEDCVSFTFSRKDMEECCKDELQALLRPIREAAIMGGALLPGDASPKLVDRAIEMEETFREGQAFYAEDVDNDSNSDEMDMLLQAKKMQQKGRKKARRLAKDEQKYRTESRKLATQTSEAPTKFQGEGISGRPISRIVLVGGATRMPVVGRLISAITGVVPQKTVDPDLAVALGCAVQVGILDGKEGFGTVLNPMQAAILKALAEHQRKNGGMDDVFFRTSDDDDDDMFDDGIEIDLSEDIEQVF